MKQQLPIVSMHTQLYLTICAPTICKGRATKQFFIIGIQGNQKEKKAQISGEKQISVSLRSSTIHKEGELLSIHDHPNPWNHGRKFRKSIIP